MNHRANQRRIFRLSAACLLAATFGNSFVFGQAVPAAPAATAPVASPVAFPPTLDAARKAPRLDATQITGVTNYVNSAIQMIATSSNAEQVRGTRSNLENAALASPGVAASADYERVFTSALSSAVTQAMKNRDVRARTSVAASVYRVAMRTKHPGLVPGVKAILQDKSEAVAEWGTRLGRVLYPTLLVTSPNDAAALAPLMISAMRTHFRSPAIAEDVLEGLSGDQTTAVIQTLGPAGKGPTDTIISLLQIRAQLFGNALEGKLPEDPTSNFPAVVPPPTKAPITPQMEVGAANYLVLRAKGTMTPQQLAATGRALFDLISEMVRLAPNLPGPTAAGSPEVREPDLTYILSRTASALQVLCSGTPAAPIAKQVQQAATPGNLNQPALQQLLQQLEKAMTDAKLLGPKPAAAPVAPAPVAPAAPRPAAPATPRPAPAAQKPAAGGASTLNK